MVKDTETIEYHLISSFYKNRRAERSGIPLINHINEGLLILYKLMATPWSRYAYCLHPLLQADQDLKENYLKVVSTCSSYSVLLAMEYRRVANSYLSDKVGMGQQIALSPLVEVNQMLIADKVQNYKDFLKYHKESHPRANELNEYFIQWLTALDISQDQFFSLCRELEGSI